MSTIKENFNQISPSEFFYRNRDLAGFSNPTRSLYTAVREFVENALDACDQQGILPNVHLTIKAVDPEKPDPKAYILSVKDNGPGIESKHIPRAFGTVLYGSKFGLKQARGMFGLGATMAILYGQITTNKPVTVRSSIDGQTQDAYEMLLDIQKNKPVILKHDTKPISKKGLTVSIYLEGDYTKAGVKIREYMYQTSLITPYATITFDDPKGENFKYNRIINEMPKPPTIINPHPYGIDVETIRRMITESTFHIPSFDDATMIKVLKEIGMSKSNPTLQGVLLKASKKWSSITKQSKVIIALMAQIKVDVNTISKIKIEDIDLINKKITYWDFGRSKSIMVDMVEDIYYKHVASIVHGETLSTFLTKRFQRVGPTTAVKFAKFAGFKPEKRLGTMTNQELVKLSDALQKYTDFLAPDPSCLAPLGDKPLEKGVNKFFTPDFVAVLQRSASAYSGFPFVIEMAIAYGGGITSGGTKVYRFANRIPLLYDEGSDVVLKVIHEMDLKRYKVGNEAPLVLVSHICSTRIPYKTVGKENVADRQEIERELRLALQYLLRKLASYMQKRGRADAEKKRASLYSKYLPLIAQFCTELAGKKKEPNLENILAVGNTEGINEK
ncbi:MAG: DNA topoisomerase VI subunit B [Cenarchaeum symbiont of Oopsacas minuta]|nr:DNA topoisomerase VI subunit B [Cenarchaeum symbiont of Oopsacas minuta]